jgi:hypothetical protein
MTLPLMPKATAVWLIEKTALTFTQIAEFCGMHPLEIQAIADGEVAQGIVGYDPIANGQVTAENIRQCEADPNARLKLAATALPVPKRAKGSRYTPVAKRNDRPDGIAFLLRNFPAADRGADRQAARHHQGDDPEGARTLALEQRQHQAARPGHSGLVQPDRPERRRALRQRTAGAGGHAVPLPPPPEEDEAA